MGSFTHNRKMLVPKKDRLIIYNNLFQEGVMVAKKDCNKQKHDDPKLPVKNIYVIKLLTSLKSRGLVEERFNWQCTTGTSTTRASSTSASTSTSRPRLSRTPSSSPSARQGLGQGRRLPPWLRRQRQGRRQGLRQGLLSSARERLLGVTLRRSW